ncbi:hypothetical protein BMF81_04683 (plasmid) [Nodularia spumigena UHCC 0039]|uniref:Uncharacterized protein n=1 Tax=Nodularia spumigena UHCC 0039 TaxID=1914872 RepID=A0A2S0QBG2_NODSP|nr:hypothetical protein BMF81_04683 [Nodularia spumigena UHCC 0039]
MLLNLSFKASIADSSQENGGLPSLGLPTGTLTGLTQKPSQTLIPLCPLRLVWYASGTLRERYSVICA